MTTETERESPLPQHTREPLTREPLEPTRERTASDVLLAAARYIEEHGWHQGNYHSADGRVCMIGAIDAVHDVEPGGAGEALLYAYMPGSVTRWNDTPGRTEVEVIAALRAAAVSS